MGDDKELKNAWDAGLTNEEYCIIGNIVAQWGALEAEVFEQTLMTFGPDIKVDQLPRETLIYSPVTAPEAACI